MHILSNRPNRSSKVRQILKELGDIAFNSRHTCKQEDIQRNQRVAEKYGIDLINKWDELRLLSLHRLVEIVHLWVGLHRDVYLYAFEVSKLPDRVLHAYRV